MAQVINSTLKGYFQTGDIPTQGNYVDLIDSKAGMKPETNSGSLHITNTFSASKVDVSDSIFAANNITASNISASTQLIADSVTVATGSFNYVESGSFEYIKVLGTVSSSGLIMSDEFTFGDGKTAIKLFGTSSFIGYDASITKINIGRGSGTVTTFQGPLDVNRITASGDISASGDITSVTGSFSRLDTSVMNASDYFLNDTQIFDVTGTGTEITLNVSTQATPNTELKGGAILINSDPSVFGTGDIELRAKGRNIKFTTGSSTKFDFNLGSSPSLIASGSVFNIISDNDEFNFADGNFQRVNNITSSGHISASGTGDHKFGGDIITAGNITASNGLLFTNETIATITANESLTLNLERTNDLNTTYFKIHNLTTNRTIMEIMDLEVFTFGSLDASFASKGNWQWMIDSDNNETNQKYTWKNYATVMMELKESSSFGTLEVTGTISSSADVVANNKVTAITASVSYLKATDLPTGDPEIAGVIYKTVDGILKVSAG